MKLLVFHVTNVLSEFSSDELIITIDEFFMYFLPNVAVPYFAGLHKVQVQENGKRPIIARVAG